MIKFKYSQDKNAQLLRERSVGFEEIIQAINDGNLLTVTDHYNKKKYPNQKILYVRLLDQIYVVPCIEEKKEIFFLKTLFASRKAKKLLISQSNINKI